ncbi:MAG: hypothetical protein MK324_12915 [Pirellulales bacterium]|nr:hypothetical protein [Pirellulales bacterium]
MMFNRHIKQFGFFLCLLSMILTCSAFPENNMAAELWARNTETPFAYVPGSERSWQLTDHPLNAGETISYTTEVPEGMEVSLSPSGKLSVRAANEIRRKLELEIELRGIDGAHGRQTLRLLPAPPTRPISYLSDQVDDLIQIFRDPSTGRWRPITRDAFDQYFRRLQCHGVHRLIVWPSAFPTISKPENYGKENWARFEKQARAILENDELNQILYGEQSYAPYQWHGLLMRFRLNPEWGQMFAKSAADHGVALTVSYRPFEHALMKYYVIPVFDFDGKYLWDFLPGANPKVNFQPQDVGFAHYRTILEANGEADHTRLKSLTLKSIAESPALELTQKHLRVFAAQVPPIAKDSFVLQRNRDGTFQLIRFSEVADLVESHLTELHHWSLRCNQDGSIRIENLKRPRDHRYLLIRPGMESGPELQLPVELPVSAESEAGSVIGRINAHWSFADTTAENATTRIAGITAEGSYRTDFQAIENSFVLVRRSGQPLKSLGDDQIVIDFGADWSPEMMDYNRAASRRLAVSELSTILASPAFDEIVINTRTHTQLAGSSGDGELGVQTLAHHRRRRKNYFHLGIDRAYAPLAAGKISILRALIKKGDISSLEKFSTWTSGDWMGTCQREADGHIWRFARNQAIANGVQLLLMDLEEEFPETRIRVMIPPRDVVENDVKAGLSDLAHPQHGKYDANYYRYLCSGINHIPAIGEGMSMLNLSGLRVEPMFLGLRDLPDQGPVSIFVDAYQKDQSDNHGSKFRGAKSFFYEAQYTLRFPDKEAAKIRREEIIRGLLTEPDISEVILYEAANWLYSLPVHDPHQYLNK